MIADRKLAAILAADVAGYSRLMADDERATVTMLDECRDVFRAAISAHHGRLVDVAGDSVLAVFETATGAVQAAHDVQERLTERNEAVADRRRMRFRIGVNLGEVIEKQDGSIYGDGVNVAARLQELAEPGGLCISGTVFDQIEGKLPLAFQSIGEQQVKNIPKPVRAYRALNGRGDKTPIISRRGLWLAAAAILVALVGAGIVWKLQAPGIKSPIASADPSLAMPTGPTIAVLPFANMSGDKKEDYFADGLTEDIITELARFRELHVLARNTTFQFKGKAVDIPEIGRALNARYVIEGSVRRSGDRIRVTAQLIDATTGSHLWAERYDRASKDVFEIQDEITGKVVGAVAGGSGGAVSSAERRTASAKSAERLQAYDLVLQATEKPVYDINGYLKRKRLLAKALELDPNYARGRQEYAWTLFFGWIFRFEKTDLPLEEIKSNAIRAVELDPSDALAHRTAAFGYFFERRLDSFRTEAEEAIRLSPNNAEALVQLGFLMEMSGEWDRGLALINKANELNPASAAGWYHSGIYYDLYRRRQYAKAIDVIRQHPVQDLCETQLKYVAVYGQLGDLRKAEEHAARCRALDPGFSGKWMVALFRFWNFPEPFIDHLMEGMAKAGYPLKP